MSDPIILPANYMLIAEEWLKRQKKPTRYWRGDWFSYNGRHYEERDKTEMEAKIAGFMNPCLTKNVKGELVQFKTSTKTVAEVRHQIMWHRNVLIPKERNERTGPNDEKLDHLIPCRNGMLDINTGAMLPHSPDYLFFNTLAFDYEADAARSEPVEWMKFVRSLWPDDQSAIDLLQEFIGYIISGDASLQKIFLMIGPKRSGKGTIEHVIIKLMGQTQCVGVNVDAFSTNFGMQNMVGKSVCFMPDQRNHSRGMSGSMTERLLTISGQDYVSIDRKYKDHWKGVLPTRIVILSNDIPQLPDASGVIASRFVPMVFEKDFFGREDLELASKLERELPQILNWAIEGLKRLRERGQFVITPNGQDMIDKIQQAAAPHLEFLADTLEIDLEGMCRKMEAFEKYQGFCEQRKHVPCSYTIFCNRVKMAFPHVEDTRPRVNGQRDHFWKGIRFKTDEKESQGYVDVTMQLTLLLQKANILKAMGHNIDADDQAMLDKVKSLLAE